MKAIRILTVLSVVISVFAALLVFNYVGATEERVLSQLQPTKVLVATADIQPGTTGAELARSVEEIVVPLRAFPKGAVAAISEVPEDEVALSRILQGSFLFRAQFGKPTRLVGGLVVPVGKVVFTLELESPERLGSFVRPGATVGVYSTREGQAILIVESAAVLAVGDQLTEGASAVESSLVTLAVSPEDAKKLLVANQTGSIRLALIGEGLETITLGR